ncbi:MAG: glycoside hydrolase family 25 protein [Acidobacteriaceae bacterium]|nr:glycoside hydrolase family 25 protein [Acidobacteriaceae bacterium]
MPQGNYIIDLSHHNATADFNVAKSAGVVGVLHKATQGTSYVDPRLSERRTAAKAAGLYWGSYHFGTGVDGVAQADFYLATATPDADELMVLDLEENTQGPSMTLDQARAFVSRVLDQTGRLPGVYGGAYISELLQESGDSLLGSCWLWLAAYVDTPHIPSAWERWTLWQYTDGLHGPEPREIEGLGFVCDCSKFNGSPEEFEQFWTGAVSNGAISSED